MKKTNKIPEILLVTRPLTPPWDEASKNFAYLLAKNLENCRFHILVGEYDAGLPKHIIQHVIYHGSSWTTLQKTKLVLKLFLLLKRNRGINIVHFLFAPTPFNARVLKSLVKSFPVKVIQTIASVPENAKEKISSALFADKLIVYSEYARNQLVGTRRSTHLRKKISIIPPFIDFSEFLMPSQRERDAIRKKWKIGKEDKVILYPGEYGRLGAMDNLLEGFIKVKTKLPEAKLFMACRMKKKEDQKIEREFKKDVSTVSLSSSVNFLGKVENIRELYAASDLTVFPVNFMEGKSLEGKFDFPFVLLESLACGTPILTSDVAALPEIWGGDKKHLEKFVFPVGRTDMFADKSLKILKQSRRTYSEELSRFLAGKFNKNEILEKYSKLYSHIIL